MSNQNLGSLPIFLLIDWYQTASSDLTFVCKCASSRQGMKSQRHKLQNQLCVLLLLHCILLQDENLAWKSNKCNQTSFNLVNRYSLHVFELWDGILPLLSYLNLKGPLLCISLFIICEYVFQCLYNYVSGKKKKKPVLSKLS